MTSRRTKCRKLRGHVSHGHGRVGKHRKHPGGRGKSGSHKHLRTWFDKYHPGFFGKSGERAMHYQKSRYYWPEININRLWKFIPRDEVSKYTQGSLAPIIDVTDFGYSKVIGESVAIDRPMVVKAKSFAREAEAAIVKAGGQCLLVA